MHLTARTGTIVERYLFAPLYSPRSAWAVIGWWERRRLFYNLIVGAAGLVTTGTALILTVLAPAPGHDGPPPLLILVYAVSANLFYSLGAPLDLLLRRWLKDAAGPVAQAIFRYGLAFSVGLTLLPIPILLFGTIAMILNR